MVMKRFKTNNNNKKCLKGSTHIGGFFLACKDFGRMFNQSLPACAFFFFFKAEIRSHTLIPLFRTGSVNIGSANRDDCGQVFPDELISQ